VSAGIVSPTFSLKARETGMIVIECWRENWREKVSKHVARVALLVDK
jgi:hypothetical protein